MKQASRLWIRKYTQPRDTKGRYVGGHELWTREDGQSRWVASFRPEATEMPRPSLFDSDALRHVVVLAFVLVVAALLALVIR